MDTAPTDYASCSLRELYQVLNYIDRERVPDSYASLVDEIASRDGQTERELLECWRLLDHHKHPEFAETLADRINALASQRQAAESRTENAKPERPPIPEDKRYKTFWRRFIAQFIDGLFVTVVAMVFLLVISPIILNRGADTGWAILPLLIIMNVMIIGYPIVMHAEYGQTLGKMATAVKVVDVSEARGLTIRQSMLRDVVPLISGVVATIGAVIQISTGNLSDDGSPTAYDFHEALLGIWFLLEVITMLFNKKRRAVHDFIAGTVVKRVPRR
ncbi:MAG: RDD family protein [Pseudomonadota bacterium]